jgi:hypothetical protein
MNEDSSSEQENVGNSEIDAVVERDPDLKAWEHARIIVHRKTFNDMKKMVVAKNFPDCWTLYCFYYEKARHDKTNRPWALDSYCIKGLGWHNNRFYKIKKLLLTHGFIEQIRLRDDKGKYTINGNHGVFVKVNFMSKYPPVHTIKNPENDNHPLEKQESGSIHPLGFTTGGKSADKCFNKST